MQDPHAKDINSNQTADEFPKGSDFEFDENSLQNKQKNKVPAKTKAIFALFLFLGCGTLIYAFLNLYGVIQGPFITDGQNISSNQGDAQNILDKRKIDTDSDGLSDYDEEYIYGTSIYLPDTDSDGYLDKQEIDSGNDPLCPAGTDCRSTEDNSSQTQDESQPQETPAQTTDGLPQEVVDELTNLTPDEVRALLLESETLTQEELNQIDDETLMQVFYEVLNQ